MVSKKEQATVRLTHPNGTVVSVAEGKAEALAAQGFTPVKARASASSKSS